MPEDESQKPMGPDVATTVELEALQCDLWATALEAMDGGPREKGADRLRPSDCASQYCEILSEYETQIMDHVAEAWLASSKSPLSGLSATKQYAEAGLRRFILAKYDGQAFRFHADSIKAKSRILTRLDQARGKRMAYWESRFLKAHAKKLKGALGGPGPQAALRGVEPHHANETLPRCNPERQTETPELAAPAADENTENLSHRGTADRVCSGNGERAPARRKRTVGSPEAVEAAKLYLASKAMPLTDFSGHAQSDERTIRRFFATGRMQRRNFELMAKAMGLSAEQLLRGELPGSHR